MSLRHRVHESARLDLLGAKDLMAHSAVLSKDQTMSVLGVFEIHSSVSGVERECLGVNQWKPVKRT